MSISLQRISLHVAKHAVSILTYSQWPLPRVHAWLFRILEGIDAPAGFVNVVSKLTLSKRAPHTLYAW